MRNPTYTSLLANSLALRLLVPTPAALAAAVVCLSALQMQTRRVEEPHLHRVHGEHYHRYAGRVGRFLPTIGRITSPQRALSCVSRAAPEDSVAGRDRPELIDLLDNIPLSEVLVRRCGHRL
jgi:hypothetical protein